MILGIMQPYFFPYLGYFDLINYSDRWIVFDTVDYIRHGWINRNRILHPSEGWQYVIVPTRKHKHNIAIKDVVVNDDQKWRERIAGQIQHYKKRAPYFRPVKELIEDCLSIGETSLSRLNAKILEKVCAYMAIDLRYELFSEMSLDLGEVNGPGDWALRISEALDADEYINPPGGAEIFEPELFDKSGIKLTIRQIPDLEYGCRGYEYIPKLSIIDVLMWNSPEEVKKFLDSQTTPDGT